MLHYIKLLQGCHLQLAELQDDVVAGTTCNKSVELNNLVASCQQAGYKQCEHILLTSCWNSIATSLHVTNHEA